MLLWTFLIALVLPLQIQAGGLLLSPARLALLILFPYVFFKWLSLRKTALDLFVGLYCIWTVVAFTALYGLARLEYMGVTVIEMLGGYCCGRVMIRNRTDFLAVIKFASIFALAMLPVVAMESILAKPVIVMVFSKLGGTYPWISHDPSYGQRMGLWRAQGVFPHPILLGLFAASIFPLLYYGRRNQSGRHKGLKAAWPAGLVTFFSLSSGAFLAVFMSAGLLIWHRMVKKIKAHWIILIGLIALTYVTVDLISDRTPFEVFISYAAFSAHNGYWRVAIFNFGLDNVWANPIFGLGLNDWVRPAWMHSSSVDNYWLLQAMRYGIPGFLLIATAWLVAIIGTARLKIASEIDQDLRRGWVLSMITSAVALVTVHMWGSLVIWMFFLLGASAWFAGLPEPVVTTEDTDTPDQDTKEKPASRGAPRLSHRRHT